MYLTLLKQLNPVELLEGASPTLLRRSPSARSPSRLAANITNAIRESNQTRVHRHAAAVLLVLVLLVVLLVVVAYNLLNL